MYTTYHFQSASELNKDIIEAIKTIFKGKPIVITVEEEQDETAFLMSNPKNKSMILESIQQDKNGSSIPISISEE
jgi:hypothetical protein